MKDSKMKDFIQGLNADEAAQVLRTLLNDNPDLEKKAYEIAMEVVGNTDAQQIADKVFWELNGLDVDDLYGHSGRTSDGYVDPYEKAGEMFEEALEPFIKEMKKNQQRGLPAIAKAYCIGIVKGLWRFDEKSSSDFTDWVIDMPGECADDVIKEWKKGNPGDDDIAEVMNIVKDAQV